MNTDFSGNGHSPAGGAEPMGDLKDLLQTLLNYGWLISLCLVGALLAAAVYYKRTPRLYQATTTVQVQQQDQQVVKFEAVVKEDLKTVETLNTIVQKLCSAPLLERVLQVNGLTNQESLLGTAPRPGAEPPTQGQLADALGKMVKSSLRRNTRLIDVTVSHRDPKLAARLANSIVQEYGNQDFETKSSSTKGVYSFLQQESERLKKKLEASERELQKYREQAGTVSMMQGQDVVIPQLRDLSLQQVQAHGESIRLKAAYDQVLNAHSNVAVMLTVPQISGDPAVSEARVLVTKLENDFSLIQQRYRPKHPKFIQATTLLEEARRGLASAAFKATDSLRISCENAVTTEQGIDKSYREAEQNAIKLSGQAIGYNLLARDVESDRAMFDAVLKRMKETDVTTEIQPDQIRVVEPATVPDAPASPKAKIIFGLALIGGLMLGFGLAFGLGMMDTSLKGVDDAEQFLHLPVLSAIPTLKEVKKSHKNLVAAEGHASQGAEAFRTLRTSLAMLGREAERRTFLFTSALPQEGKSFSSLNFAASLAQQGLRTLLIDADLRRPSIGAYLAAEADGESLPGLTDCLLGRKQLAEVVRAEKGVEHFFWLPAGKMAPNPAELLGQEKIGELIAEALQSYDRVVIDSAPIHAVSDTLLIAAKVQTVVLVLRGGKTPRKPVARSVQLLQQAGARLGGVVLNLLPRRRGGYGYYDSYYYYGYHGDYGKDQPRAGRRAAEQPERETVER